MQYWIFRKKTVRSAEVEVEGLGPFKLGVR